MRDDDLHDLTDRERRVLQVLIDEHIATAVPVGSKALAQLSDLGVSSATIRNVLGALHDRGLIDQPHTSAGRVPTDKGLRYYVDALLVHKAPTDAEAGEIAARLAETGGEEALREASRVLSRLSRHTSVVVMLAPERPRVKHIELVRLRDDAVLLIVVTVDGRVQNRLLEWVPPGVAPPALELERLAHRVTEMLDGDTFEEAARKLDAEIARARTELRTLEERLLAASRDALKQDERSAAAVHVDGAAHLLSTAESAASVKRTQELLALLDEHTRVKALLDDAMRAPGIRIFIGEENQAAPLAERGMVTAPLKGATSALGVLGVIGPRHLDYNRIVPLVDLTAHVVARVLSSRD